MVILLNNIWYCLYLALYIKKVSVLLGGVFHFILLIQGQFLIMQSEFMETLQEHMH